LHDFLHALQTLCATERTLLGAEKKKPKSQLMKKISQSYLSKFELFFNTGSVISVGCITDE
jgi:hypothetical protein